jgi:hypothetical protein
MINLGGKININNINYAIIKSRWKTLIDTELEMTSFVFIVNPRLTFRFRVL